MNKISDHWTFWIILLGTLVTPFLALSFFTHPSADDFMTSAMIRDYGMAAHIKQFYFEWCGRYFSMLLDFINPLIIGWMDGYKIFPALLILLFYLALFRFFRNIFHPAINTSRIFMIALVFLLVFVNNVPSTAECIYWLDGSLEYFTGIILMLFFMAILLRTWATPFIKKKDILLLCILTILIIGTNEISMFMLDEVIGAIILYQFIIKKKTQTSLYCIAATAVIASIFEISAPGNFSRMDQFPESGNILFSMQQSLISLIKIFGSFISDPGFLITSILFFLYIPTFRKSKIFSELISIKPVYVLTASFFILSSLYFPVIYGTGLNPALRVHNVVAFAFIGIWFLNIAVIINYLEKRQKLIIPNAQNTLIKTLGIIAFTLTLLQFHKVPGGKYICTGNICRAFYDLAFNAIVYNNELNARQNIILHAKAENSRNIVVPQLTHIPQTIYFTDITGNADHWINKSVSIYYGLDSIKTTKQIKP